MKHVSIRNVDKVDVSELSIHWDLVYIEFSYCKSFPDLTPLHDLEMLTEISLKLCRDIEDLSFLAPLTRLEKLTINQCSSLADISGIRHLKNLTSLELSSLYSLKDISALEELTNLRSLSLQSSFSITDFSPLTELENITQLGVDGGSFLSDSSRLMKLDCITELELGGIVEMSNLQRIENFEQLQKLSIFTCNALTDISVISKLGNLTELLLHFCSKLVCIAPLGKLDKLNCLTMRDGINVENLDSIGQLAELTFLDLYNFKLIEDMASIGKLKKLTHLSFNRGLKLRNLNALAKLEKLQKLNLTQCVSITDLEPIGELNRLENLNLTNCYSIVDLTPLEKLKNLSTLSIKSCSLVKNISALRKLKKLSQLDVTQCTFTQQPDFMNHVRILGEAKAAQDLEEYSVGRLQKFLYFNDNPKRIRFHQFKSSWEKFHLDEIERLVEQEYGKYERFPFDRLSTPLYSITTYHPSYIKNTYIGFDYADFPELMNSYPSHAWLAVGPFNIREQTKYRYCEELELASREQVRTLVIDGFMSSIEERYFWCAKLIVWIEDNCHSYEKDIENTLVELMAFYMIDGIASDGYDDTGFTLLFIHAISMLADAAESELSFETISLMYDYTTTYFSSYVKPSNGDLQKYAEKVRWQIIQSRLNEVYGNANDELVDRELPGNTDVENRQSYDYSERFLQIADTQATRAADRAFRALYILVDIAKETSNQTIDSAISNVINEINNAILNMSEKNSQDYIQKLSILKNIDYPRCSNQISEVLKELENR